MHNKQDILNFNINNNLITEVHNKIKDKIEDEIEKKIIKNTFGEIIDDSIIDVVEKIGEKVQDQKEHQKKQEEIKNEAIKLLTSSGAVRENEFLRQFMIKKPKGYLFFDSATNPWFPFPDLFKIDNSDFNLPKIRKALHAEYGGSINDVYLPWHFTIDIVNGTPNVVMTRPFNYKSLIPGYQEHISIMIIGDSNKDIYDLKYYKTIANFCVNPFRFLNGFYLLNQRKDFVMKTGKHFILDRLFQYIK